MVCIECLQGRVMVAMPRAEAVSCITSQAFFFKKDNGGAGRTKIHPNHKARDFIPGAAVRLLYLLLHPRFAKSLVRFFYS